MDEKWTLEEGIEKILPADPKEFPELDDLGISKRQLILDVSMTEGQHNGERGISIILQVPEVEPEEDEEYPSFSGFFPQREGETLQKAAKRVATMLGIQPDERVWEDGDSI